MRGKPLVLKQLDNGCIVPTSHKLNADTILGKLFGVTFSCACKWIREWKA